MTAKKLCDILGTDFASSQNSKLPRLDVGPFFGAGARHKPEIELSNKLNLGHLARVRNRSVHAPHSNTAAYRFFSSERVGEANILAGPFQPTRDRALATQGLLLVLHDTTEFSSTREVRTDRHHQEHKQWKG